MLKRWGEQGALFKEDSGSKRHKVYRKPVLSSRNEVWSEPVFSGLDNECE